MQHRDVTPYMAVRTVSGSADSRARGYISVQRRICWTLDYSYSCGCSLVTLDTHLCEVTRKITVNWTTVIVTGPPLRTA